MKKIISLIILIILVWVFLGYSQKGNNKVKEESQSAEELSMMEKFDLTAIPDGTYKANVASSTLSWQGSKKILVNWKDSGTIKLQKAEGTIAGGKVSNAVFTIDMSSISAVSTGKGKDEDKLSGHLKSPDFFDVAKFPTTTFKVTSIEMLDMEIIVTGDLNIKGTTNQVKFPVQISRQGESYVAKGKVSVDRTLWNVRYGSDKFFDNLGDNVISNDFTLEFSIVGKKS